MLWHEPVTEEERQIHNDFMQQSGRSAPFKQRSEEEFVIHDNCVKCGICTHVCPKGNYAFTSEGIKTHGDCDFCFACIQNCPQKAIGFSRITEVNPNARYRNEHISVMDIKRAVPEHLFGKFRFNTGKILRNPLVNLNLLVHVEVGQPIVNHYNSGDVIECLAVLTGNVIEDFNGIALSITVCCDSEFVRSLQIRLFKIFPNK